MDVAEDNSDIKLYRASANFIAILEKRLPQLLYKPRGTSATPPSTRLFVQRSKFVEVQRTLDSFQEWPQLLDPKLPYFIQLLNDAFLLTLSRNFDKPLEDESKNAVPLLRVICKLLYTFCKVRGSKVIVRFLSNEARHLPPMLEAFRTWSSSQFADGDNGKGNHFIWEEKYIMLLWLSHLMLIPFDLATVAYGETLSSVDVQSHFSPVLPPVALSILTLGLDNVNAAGKEREAAGALLIRLGLRPDMQRAGVLHGLVELAISRLTQYEKDATLPVYHLLGTLSLLSGLFNSGADDDVASFIPRCFQICHRAASAQGQDIHSLNASASSRKLLIKILRSIMLKAMLLESKQSAILSGDQVSGMLEDSIDYLLTALADKDTPIRFAAAKALSMITLKLDSAMGEEVVEAVIGSLSENLLYELPGSGQLVPATDLDPEKAASLRPNLNAVDPLRWQGLMLTLAHLLYRRCPRPSQLHNILKALLSGMAFEQRSPTGISVGTGVRDAACFGLWALSRKYSTDELMNVQVEGFAYSIHASEKRTGNVIQAVACHLVASACLDPSGNIRRGSSAALQELIGRHPNTIEEAIPLVQVVDYHAVARRSRAVLEVAFASAKLSPLYQFTLEDGLYGWRGIEASDAQSRRISARALGKFCHIFGSLTTNSTVDRILASLEALSFKGSGSTLELRHGLLLSLSNTIAQPEGQSMVEAPRVETTHIQRIVGCFQQHSDLLGEPLKRFAPRSELIFEASSSLIRSLCMTRQVSENVVKIPQTNLDFMVDRLNVHLEIDSEVVIEESTQAVKSLFSVMPSVDQVRIVDSWLDLGKRNLHSFSSKGRIAALGAIAGEAEKGKIRTNVIAQLHRFVKEHWPVEVRTAALCSLADARISIDLANDVEELQIVLCFGLSDYTTDQRGDIGSLARLEAIRYTTVMFEVHPSLKLHTTFSQTIIPLIVKLAAEKLDKVRHQAWTCLEDWWQTNLQQNQDNHPELQTLQHQISHMTETSSLEYFSQLLSLARLPWLQKPLLQGLLTSACGGTELLIRTTRAALVHHLLLNHSDEHHRLSIYTNLNSILSEHLPDDRYAIPAMEILGFLLFQGLLDPPPRPSPTKSSSTSHQSFRPLYKQTFTLLQKAHFKSTNVARLEAAVTAYEGLLSIDEASVKRDVVRKLAGAMLLHPYPKIRNMVADALVVHFAGCEGLRRTDWARDPKELRGVAEEVRGELIGMCSV